MMNRKQKQDLDFMSDIEAMRRMKPVWSSVIMLFSILALFIFFILWANNAEIDEIVRGAGQVIPSSEVQIVQSLEGGILSELMVREGDRVEQGDILARIQNVAFASEERGIEARLFALNMREQRLRAEASGEEFAPTDDQKALYADIAQSEMELYSSRQFELQNALAILEDKIKQTEASLREVNVQVSRWRKNLDLLSKELKLTRELAAQRAVPQMEVIKLERELNSLSGNIEASREKASALRAEKRVAEKERDDQMAKFKTQALSDLNETQTNKAALQENLVSAGDKVSRSVLKAPVNGIVKSIAVKTLGGVVEPAMRLIEIVPVEDDLIVTAKISPSDIAFLSVGQDVKVKITAYDPQKYGSLPAKLERIAADSITDREGNVYYEIDVVTDMNSLTYQGETYPIGPGMVANVEIITGKRTIMTYLMKPFLRARDRALTER